MGMGMHTVNVTPEQTYCYCIFTAQLTTNACVRVRTCVHVCGCVRARACVCACVHVCV